MKLKNFILLTRTSKSKNHWQGALDEAELRHTDINKEIYAKRKETIERVFANLKQKHGLRWTNQKGLGKKFSASDACFCCNEPKKISQLALEKTEEITLKRH